MSSNSVRLVEMSPRDGLQNEKQIIDIATKVELVKRLTAAGLTDIEIGAFVSPKWVPQMAGSAEVLQAVLPETSARYWVLVPNLRGYQEARQAGATRVAVFTAASESFSQKNTNVSIAESLTRIAEVTAAAQKDNIPVRGYISCALGCPFEGAIAPQAVSTVTAELFRLGCAEVSIGDTIGTGTPPTTQALFDVLTTAFDVSKLAAHFHDTYGQAIANLTVALDKGVRVIDASAGGLGGCPYAPGASGNVATEAVLRFCESRGLTTGVDAAKLTETGEWIRARLGR
jgi:hydroxymethylglutaryl-CoA lyase